MNPSSTRLIFVEGSEAHGERLLRTLRDGGFRVLDSGADWMALERVERLLPSGAGVSGVRVCGSALRASEPEGLAGSLCAQPVPAAGESLRRAATQSEGHTKASIGASHGRLLDSAALPLGLVDLSRVRSWLDARCLRSGSMLDEYLRRHTQAMVEAAKQATVVDANDAAVQLFGADSRAALTGSLDRLLALGLTDAWTQILRAMAERAPMVQAEACLTALDERQLRVLLSLRLASDPEDLENVVVCACDMTGRWQLEVQAQAAQRMEAMARLTGSIAHDFNNLLTVIQSYARFLQKECAENSTALEDTAVILDASERAACLTSQLLAFGRRQAQELRLVHLNAIVGETGRTLRRLVGPSIDLRMELADDLGLVRADPSQIEQILVNLVVNAKDALPTGGRLTIETTNVECSAALWAPKGEHVPSGSYVLLAVSDAGVGMDEAVLPHIFEPFFTTKDRRKERRGLGLSSAYGIVRQSGGHITVSSAPGKGTTLKVYLPRVSRAEQFSLPAVAEEPRAATILLVEGDEEVREALSHILRADGFDVLGAEDAVLALDLAESHAGRIDLLLTELIIPSGSGRPLADQLALLRPEAKVLYMSDCRDDAIVRCGLLDESTAHIQRPFGPETLCEAVRALVDRT